jgi:quercetin dioxygenase-like cupin family protein
MQTRRLVMFRSERSGGRPTMSRKRLLALAIALAAAMLISAVPSFAGDAPLPIAPRVLTPRSVFPDDVSLTVSVGGKSVTVEPSRTVVVKYVVQPGAVFPWHTHTGPVVVNVKRGTFTYVSDTCVKTAYDAGEAFVDLGSDIHSAFAGPKETVVVATFFNAPPEPDPLLIPATAPAGCTLP